MLFRPVPHLPTTGEIVHADEAWAEPAGGGAVAAVQLCKLAGAADFFTALGDDDLGRRACDELSALGLRLHVAWRDEPQRRAVTFLDGRHRPAAGRLGTCFVCVHDLARGRQVRDAQELDPFDVPDDGEPHGGSLTFPAGGAFR